MQGQVPESHGAQVKCEVLAGPAQGTLVKATEEAQTAGRGLEHHVPWEKAMPAQAADSCSGGH